MIRTEWVLLAVLAAIAASAVGGYWWGYSTRDGAAQRQALQIAQEARTAQDRASAAILAAGERYEALRASLAQQRPQAVNTIREIYRNVPSPPPECAVPDTARRLLISLGADGPAAAASESGDGVSAAGDTARSPD